MTTKSPHAKNAPQIRFRALSRSEIDAILERNHVGRLAYFWNVVDIEPLHYVYGEGVLYGRTSPGAKLTKLHHNQWVAFEVDEVHGLFDWSSVVIKGSVYIVEDGVSVEGDAAYARTLQRLRELVPEAMLEDDPTPHRTCLFRLHVAEATGRSCKTV